MKCVDRYYAGIYRRTDKLTKKLFGKDVVGCLAMRFELKKYIVDSVGKEIDEVTFDDVRKAQIVHWYTKYRTIDEILKIVETACRFKSFTIEEYEDEC